MHEHAGINTRYAVLEVVHYRWTALNAAGELRDGKNNAIFAAQLRVLSTQRLRFLCFK
jgi:hypothetical protein